MASGIRAVANYSVLSRVVIQSSPAAQTIQVDGTSCQTPCTLDRQSGTSMHVTAPTQVPMGVGARLDFSSWSDGGASDHTFVVSQDYTTLTVSYTNSYQLSAASSPTGGVSFQFSPASGDMFFAQNTQVTVTAVPNPGFKFLRWSGDLTGTYPSGVITMAVPRNVIAQMNAVPYIPPAGVTNAVGSTPSYSGGARIDHLGIRSRLGDGAGHWRCEPVVSEHRRRDGYGQRSDPRPPVRIASTNQCASSFRLAGRPIHVGRTCLRPAGCHYYV